MIKTYRGLLAHGGQDHIRLQTIKGKVGYRILKFETMFQSPGQASPEHVVKIYKTKQTTITSLVDFTDLDLLAVSLYLESSNAWYGRTHTIFDNEIFNQDIYVTQKDAGADSQSCNYYIELEVIPLDDAGAEYTTLKDLRQVG